MARRGSAESFDLTPREREILKALIHAHIGTGEPVSSATVARSGRAVGSPATVRAGMGVLEEQGLLAQPHTSAGRVPTDAAYRFYVDRLMAKPRITPASAQSIDAALQAVRGEFDDLLSVASRQLSQYSAHVGVVVAPDVRRIVIERIEFARLSGRGVMAILVGRSGLVHHRMLEVNDPIDQEELDRVSAYLNEHFHGMTLPRMRDELVRRMSEERARFDRLVRRSLEFGRRAVEVGESETTDVFVEGTANLLGHPEFADLDRMRALLSALEEKKRLVAILARVLESHGAQVLIGSEALEQPLEGVALVASRYRSGPRVMGSVGIVGPSRMPYARVVALVDFLARRLSDLLTDDADRETPQR